MRRVRWYVIDPRKRNRAAVLRVRWEWLARLVCVVCPRLDYEALKLFACKGPAAAAAVARAILPSDREGFAVIHLSTRHAVISSEVVSIGSLNASIVHPREVFKGAILANACAVILAHNHPSGDCEPSDEDRTITRRLVQAGEILGIAVLDHVIIGARGTHLSFRDRGIL
jgi:DNA repair protein RadC